MRFQIRTTIIIIVLSIWNYTPAKAAFPVRSGSELFVTQPDYETENDEPMPPAHGGGHHGGGHHGGGHHGGHAHYAHVHYHAAGHTHYHHFHDHYVYHARHYNMYAHHNTSGAALFWAILGLPFSLFIIGGFFGLIGIIEGMVGISRGIHPAGCAWAITFGIIDIVIAMIVLVAVLTL